MSSDQGPSTHYNALLTAAPFVGESCLDVNRSFIQCKAADNNPSKCLEEGAKVTACALKVLRNAEDSCGESFSGFQICLRDYSRRFEYCQAQQEAFEKCMNKKKGN